MNKIAYVTVLLGSGYLFVDSEAYINDLKFSVLREMPQFVLLIDLDLPCLVVVEEVELALALVETAIL